MKILLISKDGDGVGLAHKLALEGNDVLVYIQDPKFSKVGEGMFRRVSSWRPYVEEVDFVFCDMVGLGGFSKALNRMGKPYFGCSEIADVMELDRERGMELFAKFGIDTPQTLSFPTVEEAKAVVDFWEAPGYVIKPNGNLSTSSTYVTKDPDLYLWSLSQLPSDTSLIVQKLAVGVEVSTEGWFNGRDWIQPFNHTFEEKKFMDRSHGPNTGCMGNVVITTPSNKLTQATVEKLTPFLKKISYKGPIDINCIVDANQIYALEITARMGYDAMEALTEGLKEPLTDLLFEVAVGVKREMLITDDYMIAVRGSVPPWPHSEPSRDMAGMPIIGVDEHNLKHLFLTDAYFDAEADTYRYAASDGVLLKATARGRSVQEAQSRVYRTLSNLEVQDMQYRADIGNRVDNDLRLLQSWGWIKGRPKNA